LIQRSRFFRNLSFARERTILALSVVFYELQFNSRHFCKSIGTSLFGEFHDLCFFFVLFMIIYSFKLRVFLIDLIEFFCLWLFRIKGFDLVLEKTVVFFLVFVFFCLDEDFDLMIDSEIWVLFKFVLNCESFEIL
jgi:hypothetical protein